jgi:hypothetical protein
MKRLIISEMWLLPFLAALHATIGEVRFGQKLSDPCQFVYIPVSQSFLSKSNQGPPTFTPECDQAEKARLLQLAVTGRCFS